MKQSRFVTERNRNVHHIKKHISFYRSAANNIALKELFSACKRSDDVPVSK